MDGNGAASFFVARTRLDGASVLPVLGYLHVLVEDGGVACFGDDAVSEEYRFPIRGSGVHGNCGGSSFSCRDGRGGIGCVS